MVLLKLSRYWGWCFRCWAELSNAMLHNSDRLKEKLAALRTVDEKIERLEKKIVNDIIEPKTYKFWYARLNREKGVLEKVGCANAVTQK